MKNKPEPIKWHKRCQMEERRPWSKTFVYVVLFVILLLASCQMLLLYYYNKG